MTKDKCDLKEIEAFGDLLRNWRNFFTEFFNRVIKDSGKLPGFEFSISQFKVMAAFRQDKVYNMGELSKNASVTTPSMTEMIDSMEKQGIVKRLRDSVDRRVVKVSLTEKGKKLRKRFMNKRRAELKKIYGNLSKEDRDELMSALTKAHHILQKVHKNSSTTTEEGQ